MSAIFETMNTSNFRRANEKSTAIKHGEPVLSVAQVRALEARYPNVDLMRRAGRAAAEFLFERTTVDSRIVLFAGPGNNGGDALACAAELASAGYAPMVVLLADPEKYGEDARRAYDRVAELQPEALDSAQFRHSREGGKPDRNANAPSVESMSSTPRSGFPPSRERQVSAPIPPGRITVTRQIPTKISADWIVDGLFGIGLKRPLDGVCKAAVGAINNAAHVNHMPRAKVLALDAPSGIDAETGDDMSESVAVFADYTLTFIALKPGLVTGPALDYVGELHLVRLGIHAEFQDNANESSKCAALISTYGGTRLRDSFATNPSAHKGMLGTCLIIGGANGMLGAALLASRAAMRMGAGKVKLGWLAAPHPAVDPLMPEVMMFAAIDLINSECDSLVIGCGMGLSGAAVRLLKAALKRDVPIVIDADALNLIAQSADLAKLVRARDSDKTVITPHPSEAARLLGCSTTDVQRNRLKAAQDLARELNCVAVLKGAGTLIATPDSWPSARINRTGNALLATAGTGDVLAGMMGAALARYPVDLSHDIAAMVVAMHGAAADTMKARGVTRAVASDVIEELRRS
jgi:ADP-dependent NAD(P)H-hydrate dehydratase / NAD(P)H-hydrate epimerase